MRSKWWNPYPHDEKVLSLEHRVIDFNQFLFLLIKMRLEAVSLD